MTNKIWILLLTVCTIALQFFYVLGKYEVIESQKVFYWTLVYSLPASLVLSFFIQKKFTNLLFYSSIKYRVTDVSKSVRIKNKLTSIGLFLMMFNFFTYNTIILTNDWFGSDKHELVISEVINVEHSQIGSSKTIGPGKENWKISLKYKGDIVKLTTNKPWNIGDTFEMTLNTGGCWNILFKS